MLEDLLLRVKLVNYGLGIASLVLSEHAHCAELADLGQKFLQMGSFVHIDVTSIFLILSKRRIISNKIQIFDSTTTVQNRCRRRNLENQ